MYSNFENVNKLLSVCLLLSTAKCMEQGAWVTCAPSRIQAGGQHQLCLSRGKSFLSSLNFASETTPRRTLAIVGKGHLSQLVLNDKPPPLVAGKETMLQRQLLRECMGILKVSLCIACRPQHHLFKFDPSYGADTLADISHRFLCGGMGPNSAASSICTLGQPDCGVRHGPHPSDTVRPAAQLGSSGQQPAPHPRPARFRGGHHPQPTPNPPCTSCKRTLAPTRGVRAPHHAVLPPHACHHTARNN